MKKPAPFLKGKNIAEHVYYIIYHLSYCLNE